MEKLRRSIAGLSLMALLTSLVGFSAIAYAQSFSDVDTDHWAYEYVEDLYAQGVVEGYEDGTYGCDNTANRAEFSKMVSEAFGFDSETDYDPGFSDVATDAWYYGHVATLAQNGVIAGYTDADGEPTGEFGPADTVNRAAAAKMLVLAGGLELDTSFGDVFSDVDADAWYADYVNTLYANSVVDGYGDGTFGPGDDLSRCALAKMVVGTQNPVAREVSEDEDTTDEDTTDEDVEEEVEVSSGTLTVEMGDEVSGGAVPKGATAVEMLNVDLTAEGEDIVLSEMTFARAGVGSSSDFSNVYLYAGDDRLTTGRTVSSSTNTVTFSALNYTLAADEATTLTLVADFASGLDNASNTDYFKLVSADYVEHNGADTDGDFPLSGEEYTISGSTAGTVTINKYGTLSNPTVGDAGAEIAKFKLTASNEDIWVNRIALRVRGSISNSLLSNFVLSSTTEELATATSLNSSDLMVFALDTPLEIEKGNDMVFTVTADIGAADANDTILVDLDEDTDLVAVGEVYGYGAQVDSNDSDGYDGTAGSSTSSCSGWDDASCTAVEGGQVTVSFVGPTAMDVAVNDDDVTVFEFSMTSAIDVEVRKLTFRLYAGTGDAGDGLYDETGASGDANYTDIKLIDTDTGATVGSATELNSVTAASAVLEYDAFDYTDIFYVDAGETRNFGLVLDLANNTALADDTFYATLETISTSEGIRDIGTGDYVTDIVPGGTITGNTHTIQNSSLSVALASSPASDTVVQGSSGLNSTGFSFTAGKASDVTVTGLTLTGYVASDATSTYAAATQGGLNISSVVSAVRLYDGEGNLLSGDENFSTGGSTVVFTGLDWTIEAGQTEKLVVVSDIFKYTISGANDGFSMDIDDASAHITATDNDGRTVTATGDDVNGNSTPNVAMTVKTAGKISVASSSDPVLDAVAIAGADSMTDPLLVGRYQLYASDEEFVVEEMQFDMSNSDTGAIEYVILKYPTSADAPDTLDGTSSVTVVGGNADFDSLAIAVPASEDDENLIDVELYVTTNSVNAGASSGDVVEADFTYNAGFSADGLSSGVTVTHDSGASLYGGVAVTGKKTALYRDVPVFATDTSDTDCPSALLSSGSSKAVYCFSVTTEGPIGLYQLTFDATSSNLVTSSGAGELAYDGGWKIYDLDDTSTVLGAGTWSSGTNQVAIKFTSEEEVNNTTKYYVVKAPISFDGSRSVGASLSVRLASEADSVTTHVTPTAAGSVSGANVWSDQTASGHDLTTSDWVHTYRFEDLPADEVDLTES